ncbi:hypothetical protein WME79_33830 [Sorangium sp. So ce726]|uniref:hypothetical protein n=1 Tax=Sorangium sp. So ce726 TaxID=3133319 RepID=UPI003F6267E1
MVNDHSADLMQALIAKLYAGITSNDGNIKIPRNPTSAAASSCAVRGARTSQHSPRSACIAPPARLTPPSSPSAPSRWGQVSGPDGLVTMALVGRLRAAGPTAPGCCRGSLTLHAWLTACAWGALRELGLALPKKFHFAHPRTLRRWVMARDAELLFGDVASPCTSLRVAARPAHPARHW